MDLNEDAVRRRAYDIWERDGRPDGSEHRHWAQAVRELGAGAAAAEPRSSTQSAVDRLKKAALRTVSATTARRRKSKPVSA